jgi:hypothetical protein
MAFAIAMITITGCDSQSTEDSIILSHTFTTSSNDSPIRYTYSSDTVQEGIAVSLSCTCTLNIEAFLESRSFTKSEILGAKITAVRLKTFFPIGEKLDYLDQVEFSLVASNAPTSTVAEDVTFPSSQEVALGVIPGVSVQTHMEADSFSPVLTIRAGSLAPETGYELGVEFTVELEMMGF